MSTTAKKLIGEHIRVAATDELVRGQLMSYGPYDSVIVNGRDYAIDVQTPCGAQVKAARQYAQGRKPSLDVHSFGSASVTVSIVDGSPHVAHIAMEHGGYADTTDPAIVALAR